MRRPVADRFLKRRWESTSPFSRLVGAVLAPLSWLYAAAVRMRNAAYDRGTFATHSLGRPTVSIGNLTVGGTGKTPLASWFAQQLLAAGERPAILLRGYGGDEVLVHEHLVPSALVVVGADRIASAAHARARGATVLVLDDGFQHRRAQRDADVVLVSADRHQTVRMLPAGPWREPAESLRRATHIVVTRKRTLPQGAKQVAGDVSRLAPDAEVSIVHLAPDALVRWDTGERKRLELLIGARALVICAIGDPQAFVAQLQQLGARCAARTYSDHYAFSRDDVRQLVDDSTSADFAVCTLKDAVKLGPLWPPAAQPLWYLSQCVSIEHGAESLDGLVRRLAASAHN